MYHTQLFYLELSICFLNENERYGIGLGPKCVFKICGNESVKLKLDFKYLRAMLDVSPFCSLNEGFGNFYSPSTLT